MLRTEPYTSHTVCVPAMVAALRKAYLEISSDRRWRGATDLQRRLLELYEVDKETVLDLEFISAVASCNEQAINQWIKGRGFTTSLTEPLKRGDIAVAATLDLLVSWKVPGTTTSIQHEQRFYPGFLIRKCYSMIDLPDHPHPAIWIDTLEGYTVWVTKAGEEQLSGLELYDRIVRLRPTGSVGPRSHFTGQYSGIKIPMINLNQEIDLSWMVGLETTSLLGMPYEIAAAVGQNKFRLNQYGARFQSTVALYNRMTSSAPIVYYEIDEPFFCWIESKDGLAGEAKPIFAGYLAPDCWADPGDLKHN
jgi:hypothetical protein